MERENQLKNFVRYQLPLILFAGLIFYGSSIPKLPSLEFGFDYIDKLAHLIEFFIFTLLAIRAIVHFPVELRGLSTYSYAIIVSMMYAFSDEFHQIYVPGRHADLLDIAADSTGILLAVLAHFLFYRKKAFSSKI
jgi:VanZ family protein